MFFIKEVSSNLKFAWKYAKKDKMKIIDFMICNIFQIIISIVVPIISARIIVSLTANKLFQVLVMAIVLFFVENMRNLMSFISRFFAQTTYRETFVRLQLDLGKSILRLKNSAIDENSSGVFIQRLTTDTSKIADVFNILNYHLLDIVTNIGIFIAVLIVDFRIFLFMIVMVLVIGFFEQKRVSLQNEKDKVFRKENENVSGFIGELVRGVRDIKMKKKKKSFLSELHGKLVHLNNSRYDMGKVNRRYLLITGFLRDLFDLLMICLRLRLLFIIIWEELDMLLVHLVIY